MEEEPPILNYKANDPKSTVLKLGSLSHNIKYGIAILAIIFLVLVPVMMSRYSSGHLSLARRNGTLADLSNLSSALQTFNSDTGRYPTTAEGLEALVTAPAGLTTWKGPYIQAVPEDKWGQTYQYQFPKLTNPTTFDLRSPGEDGTFGTPDDLTAP